ncbi:MAG: bifunctional diguanylate cyclase/phosphodiesterase [Reyranellaceae bacterium]
MDISREQGNDRLTGLLDRWQLLERMRAVLAGPAAPRRCAVFCLDLDDFRDTNVTLGYPFGDRLLIAVADRLRRRLGPRDLLSRFGADDFVLFRADVADEAAAAAWAHDLLASLDETYDISGLAVRCTASVGYVVWDGRGPALDPDVAVARGELALHAAKARGDSRSMPFRPAMEQDRRDHLALTKDMRDGLGTDQFFLVYQPRVALEDGRMTGVEALVRWRHPTRGLLSPATFIPLAEHSGLIRPLGEWILAEACRQAARWRRAGVAVGTMAVNVAPVQLEDPRALDRSVAAALDESGLPPQALELELTESALIDLRDEQADLLRALHARGVSIAIDDFGTGYSSLQYLRTLPIDRLKVAREFVVGVAGSRTDAVIVRALAGLCRDLGVTILCEGVETAEQRALLLQLDCQEAQGYLFARPLPPDGIAAFPGAVGGGPGRPR